MNWEDTQAAWQGHLKYMSAEIRPTVTTGNEHYDLAFHKDLVNLTGTEKQITYADVLRQNMISYCLAYDHANEDNDVMATLWDWVMTQTDAAFWVRNLRKVRISRATMPL